MDIEDKYFIHYILSLHTYAGSNSGQLENIFHGRRTPSMLYLAVKNKWFHSFNLFPKIKREEIQDTLSYLEKNKWIIDQGKKYVITDEGMEKSQDFFKSHKYPTHINSIKHEPFRMIFWKRFQLMTQIISEKEYKNTNYSPISRNMTNQSWAKFNLRKFDTMEPSFSEKWIKETIKIFSMLSKNSADLLSQLLTGHEIFGDTFRQISIHFNWTQIETLILFNDSIEELIQVISTNNSKFDLLEQILNDISQEFYYGLSKSSFKTALLLNKSKDLQEVADRRNLKVSTIKEHLLEIAIIQDNFDFKPFIFKENYHYLNKIFDQFPTISYRELKDHNNNIDFMNFRLVELERLRSGHGFN